MIRIEWANYDDLVTIANWLSDADRMELALTRDPDDYLRLADDAYQSRYKLVALDHAARPIFAFGANPVGTDMVQVWGFKTKDGPCAIRAVTKCIRSYMIPGLRRIGINRAACYVHRDNHGSRKWLAHLGFEPRATDGEIGTPLIHYQRDDLRGFPTGS